MFSSARRDTGRRLFALKSLDRDKFKSYPSFGSFRLLLFSEANNEISTNEKEKKIVSDTGGDGDDDFYLLLRNRVVAREPTNECYRGRIHLKPWQSHNMKL